MADNTTTINPAPTSPSRFRSRRLWLMAAILVLAIGGGAVAYWQLRDTNPNHHIKTPPKTTYSKLETYKVPGLQTNGIHDGITFLKPSEFTVAPGTPSGPRFNVASLVDFTDQSKKYSLGTIGASSFQLSVGNNPQQYIDSINNTLRQRKGDTYKADKQVYKNYLGSFVANKFDVELKDPTPLQTPNIKKNAWQFDFAYISKNIEGDHKDQAAVMQGKLILAFGQNTYYYFFIDSAKYNWENNLATWQKVIDSIKIDQ